MPTDWQDTIKQLKEVQSRLKPGDTEILDIEATIQAIKSDALEGNFGHAQYFAATPGAKEGAMERISKMVDNLLPKGKEIK